jgi:hypothetical protein
MTDAVASVATAATQRVLLERSPQASRTIDALRYTLDAMRSERTSGAMQAALPPQEGATFADEIRRQASIAGPRQVPVEAEPQAEQVPPASDALAIPAWDPPATTPASPNPPAPESSENIPLDIMQWARGVGSDERDAPPVSFDEPAPERMIAPDITRLAEAEQNQIPRDVLEIMRAMHLGAETGNTDGR